MPSLGKLEHKPVRAETGEEARLPGTVFGTAGQRAVRGRRAPTRLVIGAGACVHLLPRAPDHTHAPHGTTVTHEKGVYEGGWSNPSWARSARGLQCGAKIVGQRDG